MIYVTDRTYIHVRLGTFKLSLRHGLLLGKGWHRVVFRVSWLKRIEKRTIPQVTVGATGEFNSLEPTTGIEPVNLFLTKEVLYLLSYVGAYIELSGDQPRGRLPDSDDHCIMVVILILMERETGIEPATLSLEG